MSYLFPHSKICKNCRCPKEDHDLPTSDDADFRPISLLFDSNMTPRDGTSDWMTLLGKLSIHDPAGLAQMCSPQTDIVISRLISENMVSTSRDPTTKLFDTLFVLS